MKEELLNLIAEGELEQVLQDLVKYPLTTNEAIHLSGNLQELKKEIRNGSIPYDTITEHKNKIRASVISLVNSIKGANEISKDNLLASQIKHLDRISLVWLNSLQSANASFVEYIIENESRHEEKALELIDNVNNELLSLAGEYELFDVNKGEKISPFKIAKTLVSQIRFKEFLKETNGYIPTKKTSDEFFLPKEDLSPIIVTWVEAVKYANWLSEKRGFEPVYKIIEEDVALSEARGGRRETIGVRYKYEADFSRRGLRLPTFKEWRYAVRFGIIDDWGTSYEWCNDRSEESDSDEEERIIVGNDRLDYKLNKSDHPNKSKSVYFFRLVLNIPDNTP